MLENVGEKIIFLSKVKLVLNMVALLLSIPPLVIVFGFSERLLYIFLMVIYCIVGIIFSVVGTWLAYGFGKVVNFVEIKESSKNCVVLGSESNIDDNSSGIEDHSNSEQVDKDNGCYLYNIDCTRNKNKVSSTTKLLIILVTGIIVFIKFGFNLDLLILLKDISHDLCM